MEYELLGYGYTWWSSDPLPPTPPLADLRVAPSDDCSLLAALTQLDAEMIVSRIEQGHQPYVAYLGEQAIAYGWSAARLGAIDELALVFEVPPGNRYLWDFVTLPEWRGYGVYRRLLQAILMQEQSSAERFWIGHVADNHASRQGILKAGFQRIEALVRMSDGELKILPFNHDPRAALSPIGRQLGVLAVVDENHR